MHRPQVVRAACAAAVLVILLAAGIASGARVVVGNIVLTADGGFRPNALPKKTYAPISLQGHGTISTKDGATPPAVQTILFDVDRNGHLETRGLPVCQPGEVANTTVVVARMRCKDAIVGTGFVQAIVTLPGQAPVPATSPLTFFNGPRQGGNATIVIHAYATVPAPTTYVLVTTIAKVHKGRFGYEVSTDVPSIAGGYGSLTEVSFSIHRVYTYKGHQLGYTSARCADGLLEARGRFTFADGTVVAGSVFKPCRVRR